MKKKKSSTTKHGQGSGNKQAKDPHKMSERSRVDNEQFD